MTALSARLKGCDWTFAPMMDIARDARWGRIAEGAGQDPYLCSLWSAAQVKGFQGDDVSDGLHLAACAKHYVGYGAGEGGRDYDAVEMSEGTFRDIYLPPFASAVKAGVLTVMPAFHSFNGVPCAVNGWLLTDVLRGELGFAGFTISDWEAIAECDLGGHGVGDGPVELGAMSLKAGMDMSMVDAYYEKGLKAALAEGRVSVKDIDTAVGRILTVKMKLGLFERPLVDAEAVKAKIDLKKDLATAREAAAKSCVLLKNANSVLPLRKGAKVSLLGAMADDEEQMQGCWSSYYEVKENATLRQGLAAAGFDVKFSAKYEPDASADVVVAVFGEKSNESGEGHSRSFIGLRPEEISAIDAIKASGKPFVAVLMNGRPLAIPELAEKADAILEGWFLGSCAGEAIADIMSGARVPTGRLTVDFPRTTGACPVYYNRLPTGRPSHPNGRMCNCYIDSEIHTPQYPFGFGLGYSEIAYSGEKVEVKGDAVVFTATVANRGAFAAEETVQAYVRDLVGAVSRPKRELKGFAKVALAPGESKTVEISVPRSRLVYHAGARKLDAEGKMQGWIAPDSISGKALDFTL
jgi:beta-glucosidase